MKKNFFKKKLASGLALALVVASLAPAGLSASAATATKVVKQGGGKAPTVMYVGGAKVDYSLSKVYKSNKYAWTVSDSSIATITKTTGVVTAKAPGTVTIKATARNSSGKWLNAFTHKITIKQRVTSIDISAEDFSLAIGEEKDLDAVKNPKTSTDSVRYASSDEKVATVNATTGVVKAVGVGEATITVYSKATWNTPNTSTYNRTDSVKVSVLDGIQAVKQTTPAKLEVTLATDAKDKLTKDNLVITDANGVKQVVKEVKFSEDGKTATVETYINFVDKATYKVSYADTEKEFVASVGKVASIVVAPKTVQYGKETALSIKLFDANGVDVTTDADLQNVTFDYDTTKAYIGSFDKSYKINVFTYPTSVNVKATYHTNDWSAGLTEKVYESSAVIASVEKLPELASGIKYTVAKTANWDKVSTTLPATAEEYQLFIKAKSQDDADLTAKEFEAVSTDESILVVSKSDDKIFLYPVKTGAAYVKVTYGNTVQLLPVTVGVESKAATITLDKKSATLSSAITGDKVSIGVTVKDQYGTELSGDAVKIEPTFTTTAPITTNSNGNKAEFTIDSSATKTATYTYKLTYKGKSDTVSIKVDYVTDTKAVSIVLNKSTDSIDTVVKDGTKSKNVDLELYGLNAKGQKVALDASTEDITYTISKNGSTEKIDELIAKGIFDTNSDKDVATFAALQVSADANDTVTKAAVGTYFVSVKAKVDGVVKTSNVSFTIKDTQKAPTITRKNYTNTAATLKDIIETAFKYDDKYTVSGVEAVVNSKTTKDLGASVDAGVTVYFKTITLEEKFSTGVVAHTVKVDSQGQVRIVE